MHTPHTRQDWPAPYRDPYGYAESGFAWGPLIAVAGSLLGDIFGGDDLESQNQALQQQLQQQQQQQFYQQQMAMQQQQKPAVPTWVWIVGAGGLAYFLLRDRK